MSTNQILSLFPEHDFQTKKACRERALSNLGIINTAKKSKPSAVTVTIEKLDDDDYDLLSFDFSGTTEVPQVQLKAAVPEVGESEVVEARAKWTAMDVAIAHERMLVSMLEDIRDKRVGDERLKEWLCWAEGLEENYGRPLPFSYEACCHFWDINPDDFRHRITYVLRHHRGWNIRWHERVH